MIRRFSKLSLRRGDSKNMESEDIIIPPNQEEISKIKDLDLSVNLPENHGEQERDISNAMAVIKKKLDERQFLAKKKESLIYGQRTGLYPVWFSIRSKCFLNLEKEEDSEQFKSEWAEIVKDISKDTSQKVINYLQSQIKKKEGEINQERSDAFCKIGFTTDDSADARNKMDADILELNKEYTKDLEHYRKNISITRATESHARNWNDRSDRKGDNSGRHESTRGRGSYNRRKNFGGHPYKRY